MTHNYKITAPGRHIFWLYVGDTYATVIVGWDVVREVTRDNAAHVLRDARRRGYKIERKD
jgi:hypothetical protein